MTPGRRDDLKKIDAMANAKQLKQKGDEVKEQRKKAEIRKKLDLRKEEAEVNERQKSLEAGDKIKEE
jgi:hypothetical protein